MPTLTISYQGTLEDLFSVPIPHLATLDAEGRSIGLLGGEIAGLKALIGFTSAQGPIDFRSADFRGITAWMERLDKLRGWFPVYTDARGIPFTYPYRIERIEVTP